MIGAEGHVDEIRAKHELVVFVHDLQIDATGEARLEQEGGLQAATPAPSDDTGWR